MANNRNGTPDKILQRESEAFKLRRLGWSQLRVAEHMGMTQQGVSKALKRVSKRFSQQFLQDVRQVKHEQVVQLENLADEAIMAWYKSKEDKCGDSKFLTEFRKAKEDIRTILGADLPVEPDCVRVKEVKITIIDPKGYLNKSSET